MKILYFAIFLTLISCSCSDDSYIAVPNVSASYVEGEELLAGTLTINSQSSNAFGRAFPGISQEDQILFGIGNSLFNQSWVSAPASTTARDGLGPTFNSRACASCHTKDGRGLPITDFGLGSKGFLMRISLPGITKTGAPLPVPNYGDQIQDQANLNSIAEASIHISYELIQGNYPDGTPYELRKPVYKFQNEQFGSLSGVLTSPRVGTQTIGLGLIEALDDLAILNFEDPQDIDGDGISGKANYVWNIEKDKKTLGRFGWKANQPSLKQQVARAFHGDMGLTTALFPDENCPGIQNECAQAVNGGDPEVTDIQLDRVTFYQKVLAVPIRRNYKEESVLKGKALFSTLACIKCHRTGYTTKKTNDLAILNEVTFHPYSDFLLHDMGEGLADNRPDFEATGSEWRTQPLWGIGLIPTVNNHSFLLHDGRARSVEEAILWHGGEAEQSKNNFMQLSVEERKQLIDFINSL